MDDNSTRVISGNFKEEDRTELTFRPTKLDDFIGQEKVKENLRVYIEAAKKRKDSLDHILLSGPPGLGKTTLAFIVAQELGVNFKSVQAPVFEKTGDIAAHLTNLLEHDVFFIDEVHRLRIAIEELLYSAMEDYKLDIVIGQGAGAKSIKIPLPHFTLIGATTRAGLLTSPLMARFGIVINLDFYVDDELKLIALRTAKLMGISMDDESAFEIAKRSRGTPRVVNRIVRRIRDFAQVYGEGKIDIKITRMALQRLEIDENGLDSMDRKILLTLLEKYDGGPVGVETIAISIGEEVDTISDVYEPFLVQRGFIARTPRGRKATSLCYKYFGLKYKEENNLPF